MKNPDEKPGIVVGTLAYLRRRCNNTPEIVLALVASTPKTIKRGLAGKRNTYGGGLEPKDGLYPSCISNCGSRETVEECGVLVAPERFEKVAVVVFHNWWGDYECSFLVADVEDTDPRPTNIMLDPRWFPLDALPFDNMMKADKLLLPTILYTDPLKRKLLWGHIWHDKDMHVERHSIEIVQKLP